MNLFWCGRDGNMATDWLARKGSLLSVTGVQVVNVPHPDLEVLLVRDTLRVG